MKIKDTLISILALGFVAAILGCFFVYFIAIVSYPLTLILAIYRIISHFF